MDILDLGEDYLSPEERERRSREKQRQAIARELTPDWFITGHGRDFCLPDGLRVAVIGAGFAGLWAAYYLHACGANTTVYEAADRVGGRVLTDRAFIPGKTIEAGAELIGENHPLWLILARRGGLTLAPLSDDDDYEARGLNVRFRLGSTDLTRAQKSAMKASLRPLLLTIGAEGSGISETTPWNSPSRRQARRIDATSVQAALDRLIPPGTPGMGPDLARKWFEFTVPNDNCAPLTRQSYLGLLASVSAARMGSDPRGMLGYWMSTETHRCVGGNQQLADIMATALPDVRLSTRVIEIQIEKDYIAPIRITAVRPTPTGAVRTRDDFHLAVLATPPTVWSAIRIIDPFFVPARFAIQQGPAVKFMSRYTTEFWVPAGLAPSVKWDQLGSVWEGTDGQSNPPGFDLTVYAGGPLGVLGEPAYRAGLAGLYPTGATTGDLFADWTNTPFIMTGYGVPDLLEVTTIGPTQQFPHRGVLYIVGEQTSMGFFGYMEGALQSGGRAARHLVHRFMRRCDGSIEV